MSWPTHGQDMDRDGTRHQQCLGNVKGMYDSVRSGNLFRKAASLNFSNFLSPSSLNWESLHPALNLLAPRCRRQDPWGHWICQDSPQEAEYIPGLPKEDMVAKETVQTSQYGSINFESVSTGLNVWTIIITMGIMLAIVCFSEACCGGPSTWLQCCFHRRYARSTLNTPPSAPGQPPPEIVTGNACSSAAS